MTADQREQALAAVQIIRAQVIDHGASLAASLDQQFAVVLAALTPPPLPAGLAEIQARADADDQRLGLYVGTAAWDRFQLLALLRDRDAELAELRARPTLTAEQAREALSWAERLSEESDDWEPRSAVEAAAASALRTIAEGAGQ